MSRHGAAPPLPRPSSAASSSSATSHDHSRPLPPPRPSPEPPTTPMIPVGGSTTTVTATGVTLQAPRPDGERLANEYVETPFRPVDPAALANNRPEGPASDRLKASNHQRACGKAPKASASAPVGASVRGPAASPVTKQPVSFTKEPAAQAPGRTEGLVAGPGGGAGLSIMCDRCGRCRCESCREPPPLPSRWLCDNACLCSAETALDYASCLCCVKGLLYHCADGGAEGLHRAGPTSRGLDDISRVGGLGGGAGLGCSPDDSDLGGPGGGADCADEPCSCVGPNRAARWSCLGALSLLLPCLLCYWPLRACVGLCELCYAKHATQGCRCDPRGRMMSTAVVTAGPIAARDTRDPEKRLLDPAGLEL